MVRPHSPMADAAPIEAERRGTAETVTLRSARGRWIVAGAVLGSGAVFVESTVVTIALPAIDRDLDLGVAGLQWVMNGYLLPLSALMLLGGALGDRFRRSTVFAIGCVGFAIASLCCALAPSLVILTACRVLQGAAGALLVPNSLAMLEASFEGEARGEAIGRWAAWSAVSTAAGPLVGGWVVEAVSWRWIFASVAPLAVAAAWIALRHMSAGEQMSAAEPHAAPGKSKAPVSVDYAGAVLVTLGLAGVVGALIVGPEAGFTSAGVLGAAAGGVACLAAFVVVERRAARPLLPFEVFRSRQFTGANVTTLLVYAALGGLFLFLMLQLQNVLGYDALTAGAALLPINAAMLVISPRAGRLAARIGARLPMTVGALIAAVGMLLFTRVQPGAGYVDAVLPAAAVFGLGLSTLVAPLTSAVLGAVEGRLVGVASAVNNAVARVAGLLATAVLPLAAGLGGIAELRGPVLGAAFVRAMWISAALCAAGALAAWLTVRRAARVEPSPHPSPHHGCVGASLSGAQPRAST